jgi:hypothetical protein
MRDYPISVEHDVSPELRRLIEDGLTRHALPTTRVPGFQPIAVVARDARGAIAGGIVGTTN